MEAKALIGAEFLPEAVLRIAAAKSTIRIIVFDWRLYPTQPGNPVSLLVAALCEAQRRGVEVRVLLSNEAVRQQLGRLGFICKSLYSTKLVHAKVMLIDTDVALVGSHNYTQAAFTMNLEVSVCVVGGEAPGQLVDYFEQLWPL